MQSGVQCDVQLTDCFSFDFVGLPHMIFQREEFNDAVAVLSSR